jgi:citrate lyase subunit beta/citryl-CoA lyase
MSEFVRTWLYVPAHRTDRTHKALTAGADAIVLDLEDSVPVERKGEARQAAVAFVEDLPVERPRVWVRLNPLDSPWGEDDLSATEGLAVDGVRLPRAEQAGDIRAIADRLGRPLQLLVETARGLMNARDLAEAHPAVAGIALGEADLAADLRVAPAGLDWARGWIVGVARAAGLPSPVQSVYTAVTDLEGLRATTIEGRQQGFFGRSVIHPRQIETIHEVCRPSAEELHSAEELIAAYDRARERGEAAALTPDGRFVDPAVIAQAQLTVELAALEQPTPTATNSPKEN